MSARSSIEQTLIALRLFRANWPGLDRLKECSRCSTAALRAVGCVEDIARTSHLHVFKKHA